MSLKILITGCAGFIGCHLSRYFLERQAHIVGIDNLSRPGSRANLAWLQTQSNGNLDFYCQDICSFNDIVNTFKRHAPFDIVIHEAAQVAVTTSTEDPRSDFEINAIGTFNLLEATRLYSPEAFFQYASTNKVYGKMDNVAVVRRNGRYEYRDLPAGISEEFPLDFHSPYGCSKGSADQYVRDYHRIFGLKTAVLRQSCIYGSRQFGIEDQGWIAWFSIASFLNKKITIYGDGRQIRDVLWVDDLVDAYLKIFENSRKTAGQIFNIGGGPENILSILELVALLKERGFLMTDPSMADWRPGDQKVFVSDIQKVNQMAGWRPTTSVEEGLDRLSAWVADHEQILKDTLG